MFVCVTVAVAPVAAARVRVQHVLTVAVFALFSCCAATAACCTCRYSDFMTLVESGRVRAARLEAASSKLYFECQPVAAAADATVQASSSAAQAATRSSKQPQQPAAAGAGTAAAAVLPAAAKQPLRKSFYVKLADRHDPVLVGKILTAGAASFECPQVAVLNILQSTAQHSSVQWPCWV
jgi:hypothetical protein